LVPDNRASDDLQACAELAADTSSELLVGRSRARLGDEASVELDLGARPCRANAELTVPDDDAGAERGAGAIRDLDASTAELIARLGLRIRDEASVEDELRPVAHGEDARLMVADHRALRQLGGRAELDSDAAAEALLRGLRCGVGDEAVLDDEARPRIDDEHARVVAAKHGRRGELQARAGGRLGPAPDAVIGQSRPRIRDEASLERDARAGLRGPHAEVMAADDRALDDLHFRAGLREKTAPELLVARRGAVSATSVRSTVSDVALPMPKIPAILAFETTTSRTVTPAASAMTPTPSPETRRPSRTTPDVLRTCTIAGNPPPVVEAAVP
jgi:hypothetical protein